MRARNTGKITITFTANANPGAIDVPQRVTLKDLTTGVTVRTWEHTGSNTVAQTIEDGYLFVPGRSYQLYCLVDTLVQRGLQSMCTAIFLLLKRHK